MPTVTFDTNVIEFILDPNKMERGRYRSVLTSEEKAEYLELRRLIRDCKIRGCVSRTYFSYEAIRREDRRDALIGGLELTIPRLSFYARTMAGARYVQTRQIKIEGPFRWYLEQMRKYELKILWNDRKLWPLVPDLVGEDYLPCEEAVFNARQREAAKVVEEELLTGFSILESELRMFRGDTKNSLHMLLVPRAGDEEREARFFKKIFPSLIGEAADGDMVISHYAHCCDYLCTNDQGEGFGGGRSIFASRNVKQLSEKLGVKIVTPHELLHDL